MIIMIMIMILIILHKYFINHYILLINSELETTLFTKTSFINNYNIIIGFEPDKVFILLFRLLFLS